MNAFSLEHIRLMKRNCINRMNEFYGDDWSYEIYHQRKQDGKIVVEMIIKVFGECESKGVGAHDDFEGAYGLALLFACSQPVGFQVLVRDTVTIAEKSSYNVAT